MGIEAKIINFRKAIKENKPKSYIKFKFTQYIREYDKLEDISVIEKQNHRDLFLDYIRYMSKSGDGK